MNVGILVTGGAVSGKLLNNVVASASHEIYQNGGTPFILSGGWGAILNKELGGIREISKSDITKLKKLSRTSFVTDRRLPKRSKAELDEIISKLDDKKINRLIVIGGNGSASALIHLYQHTPNYFTHIIQILKTMDGDCVEPFYNLGFSSTLTHSCKVFRAYDNETSLYGSPYIVKMLGREVGQLCLHLGLREKPGLALMREEFGDRKLSFDELSLLLASSSLKQLVKTGSFGTMLLSEGLIDCLDEKAQKKIGVIFVKGLSLQRIDFTKVHLEESLKESVSKILSSFNITPFGVPLQVGARSIGYYARAEEPDKIDLELAINYGKRAGTLSTTGKRMKAPLLLTPSKHIPLESILNSKKEVEQCWVNVKGKEYKEFVKNQYRFLPEDLENDTFEKISRLAKLNKNKLKPQLKIAADIFKQLPF